MDLNFHGISFFIVPSKRCVGFLEGICSGSVLPPWFNQSVLLNVRLFVPLQFDLPWFLWHQLSCSFSFTLKILGLECGVFFCFHPCKAVKLFYLLNDEIRTGPVWWTLIFMALADFSSVKKKCWFSGGHLFWLPVATMIQIKCSFKYGAFRTTPVWWAIILMPLTEF